MTDPTDWLRNPRWYDVPNSTPSPFQTYAHDRMFNDTQASGSIASTVKIYDLYDPASLEHPDCIQAYRKAMLLDRLAQLICNLHEQLQSDIISNILMQTAQLVWTLDQYDAIKRITGVGPEDHYDEPPILNPVPWRQHRLKPFSESVLTTPAIRQADFLEQYLEAKINSTYAMLSKVPKHHIIPHIREIVWAFVERTKA